MADDLFGRKYSLIIGSPKRSESGLISQNAIANRRMRGEISEEQLNIPPETQAIFQEQKYVELNDLQIKATLPILRENTSAASTAESATIEIYNLSRSTITSIKVSDQVFLSAGYAQDVELPLIYSGQITHIQTTKRGVDTITTLTCSDHIEARLDFRTSRSWPEGTSYDQILTELLGELQRAGIPLGRPNIPEGEGIRIGNQYADSGYTVSGNIFDVIQDIAEECQYNAYFVNGAFYLEPRAATKLTNRYAVSVEDVKEFIKERKNLSQNNKDTEEGIVIKLFLDGRVKADSIIDIDYEDFKGTYSVKKITHYLDYEGDWWETELLLNKVQNG